MKSRFITFFASFSFCLSACIATNNTSNQSQQSVHVHVAGSPVQENNIDPTCTQDGSYDLVTYCVDDHEEMSREHKTIPALGHDYQKSTTAPTYESDGLITYTCSRCGDTYTEKGDDKLQHHYSDSWSYNETSHWHACTDAGYEDLKSDEAPHTFRDVVTHATYESGGYTTHTCNVCGYSFVDSETNKLSITITWKNYDGSILEIDENVPFGSIPSYDGATPTKPNQDVFSYTFKGWSPAVEEAIEPVTYTAQYEQEKVAAKLTITYALMNPKTDKAIQRYSSLPAEVGEISTSQIYDFNTNVNLTARMNEGYIFLGWYYENTLVSNYTTYNYVIWDEDASIEARFCYKTYDLTIYSNSSENGLILLKYSYTRTYKEIYYGDASVTVSIISETIENKEVRANYQSTYDYKSQVSVAAFSQTSVRFLGWYDEDNHLVSTKAVYTFDMPNKDYKLEAKWDYFHINYNLNGGTNNENNPSTYSTDDGIIELRNPTKNGYNFVGWKLNGEPATSIDTSLVKDITLEAVWDAIEYSINYNLNGGTNNKNNPSIYNIEDSTITLSNPSRVGYNFAGWYLDSKFANRVFEIKHGSYGNVNLFAKWEVVVYSIHYTLAGGINNPSNPSSYTVEDSITLGDPSYEFRTFNGWYLNNKKITIIAKGTTGNLNLVAKWSQTDEQKAEEERTQKYATKPLLSDDGKTITYGLYPQTNVDDPLLISDLNALATPDSNGWYLYEGDYYAKLSAKPYLSSYYFDNGTKIVRGTTYWFKCEPIVWNVLGIKNGKYCIVSSVLLDAHLYYNSSSKRTIDGQTVYANNYKYSDIRTWLNNDFYNSAFALGNSHIQTTIIDNSATTTANTSNSYACVNTEDKVFLPSYKDYINSSYGFPTSPSSTKTRRCITTDWARARGAEYNDGSSYNGMYWTRSPSSGDSRYAVRVGYTGDLDDFGDVVFHTNYSVRPAITIKIS